MKKLLLILLMLAPLMTNCRTLGNPTDCRDIQQQGHGRRSGVYTIYPRSRGRPVKVFCDMDSLGGGWTVFQRRMDGSLNFYRPWEQYKQGFGDTAGEHWLGLENIHQLTKRRRYELLVNMQDFDGRTVYARYLSFSVGDDCNGYRLTVSGFINGGAGDALTYHSGQKFSTFDKDQDSWPNNCARSFLGAFWYNSCHHTNPNGVYRWGPDATLFAVGVEWYHWKGWNYSLQSFSMKIRPVH